MIRTITDYQHPSPILNITEPFDEILNDSLITQLPSVIHLGDHIDGVDASGHNFLLDKLTATGREFTVFLCFIPTAQVIDNYPNLNLKYARDDQEHWYFSPLREYTVHPVLKFENFVCSFNGTDHVSRKMLVAVLNKFGWYDPKYSSKNFTFTKDALDGHIEDFVGNRSIFYRKFFITDEDNAFFTTVNGFGHNKFNILKTIDNLSDKITHSFLHIVSESLATSYQPFITEKFMYSVITRGLFLAWAQPGWHFQLQTKYGFKLYHNLFDYKFDQILNPVERLIELMSMISKFSKLSPFEWHDLYLLEQDTIEYNYNHYFSRRYLDCLRVDNSAKNV